MLRKTLIAAAFAAVAASQPARADVGTNGIPINGISFNGVDLKGLPFNGISFNGLASNGGTFNSLRMNGNNGTGMTTEGAARVIAIELAPEVPAAE